MIQKAADVDVHLVTSNLFTRDGRGHVKLNTIPQHQEALKRTRQRRGVRTLHWCDFGFSKKALEIVFSSLVALRDTGKGSSNIPQVDYSRLPQASTLANTGSSQYCDGVNYESDGLQVSAGALAIPIRRLSSRFLALL